jgi:hypothetical protein
MKEFGNGQEAQAGRDYRKLREAEIVLAQGGTTADACRRIAVTEQTIITGVRNMVV